LTVVAGGVVSTGLSVSVAGALTLPAVSLSVAETAIASAPVKMFGLVAYSSKPPLVAAVKSARSCAALSATPLTLTVTAAPAATVKPESSPAFFGLARCDTAGGEGAVVSTVKSKESLVAVFPAGSVAMAICQRVKVGNWVETAEPPSQARTTAAPEHGKGVQQDRIADQV
jgi:hypothetical protein